MDNNQLLRQLKDDNFLTVPEIAELMGAKFNTVRNWFKSSDSPAFKKAPDYALSCLVYALHLKSIGVDPVETRKRARSYSLSDHESEKG